MSTNFVNTKIRLLKNTRALYFKLKHIIFGIIFFCILVLDYYIKNILFYINKDITTDFEQNKI